MENSNTTEFDISLSEHFGLLFYIINPWKHSCSSTDLCPDYVGAVTPLITCLILLEALINHFIRGREQNLADSVTSITSGLLMTMAGMLTRFIMIQTYETIHQEYRVTSLAWDSVVTWVVTAVLVDLGYYWFHRASHEVGVLWAVHQVHHSSQHFNLSTALR